MTPKEYWEGDGDLPKYYRKAEELRQERINWQLHLQGMYVYEAICDASPLFQTFAKKGTKAIPYRSVPYGVEERPAKIDKDAQTKRAMQVFSAKVAKFNENFRKEAENAESANSKY